MNSCSIDKSKGGPPMEDRYNVECCDFIHAHEGIVEQVRETLPGEDTLYDLTELFRIFADSTRVRILYVLFESEMCVCDIAALLGMTQSAISCTNSIAFGVIFFSSAFASFTFSRTSCLIEM